MLPTSSSTQSLKSARLRRTKHRSSWLRANAVGLTLLAAATLIAFSVFYAIHQSAGLPHGFREEGSGGGSLRRSARMLARNDRVDLRTLVIYVYSGTDPEYEENLRFFLREGVKEGDGVTYIIALQHGTGLHDLDPTPVLPPNARFVNHPNHCFDIGTVAWVLENHVPDPRAFNYFIWLNSSVRGPFLPAYHPRDVHWSTAFTRKLTGDVKLVGSTINCGGAYALSAQQPHVQSYAVAMDQVGLDVIKRKGSVLQCHKDMAEMVTLSEIGMSKAVLEAGYNLDCLMLRYQGVDWRDSRAQGCNAGRNPIQESFYDGVNADPLEVLFVKVKNSMHAARWQHVLQAVKYDEWAQSKELASPARFEAIAKNGWTELVPARIADAQRRGAACFDRAFYVNANHFDLGFIEAQPDPQAAAWQHFLNSGIHDGRPHRFTC